MRRSVRNRVALVCVGVPALVEVGLGVTYLGASDVMPYHREAIGADAATLGAGTRALLLTLLNGYGSAHLATGTALLALMLPLTRGERWARWAILAVGLPVLAGTTWLSWRLAHATGAGVPWQGALALLVLFLVGVALAAPASQPRGGPTGDGAPETRSRH